MRIKDIQKKIDSINSTKLKVSDAKRTIHYPSETGRAYIGYNKKPLVKVKKGFGFKGVLLQNENRTLVQCHVCGKWYQGLNGGHLLTHNTNQRNYRKQFGLERMTGLVADATSYQMEASKQERFHKMTDEEREKIKQRFLEIRKSRVYVKQKHREEYKNKQNTCDAQIQYRLKAYVHQYRELPKRTMKGEGSRLIDLLKRKYGPLEKGYALYGLPFKRKLNGHARFRVYEMIAPNKESYFVNTRRFDKNDCYKWMVDNCKVLSQ